MVFDMRCGRWFSHIQKHLLLLLSLSILCTIHGYLSSQIIGIIMVWPHETKLGLDKQVIILIILIVVHAIAGSLFMQMFLL